MFDFIKNKNKKVIYTKDELACAISNKEPEIIVGGELAKQLKWIAKLSPGKVTLLIGALALLIPTLGPELAVTSSLVGVSGVAEIVGVDIAKIIIASGLSISVILSVLKGYNVEIEKNKLRLTANTSLKGHKNKWRK